jgi:hypothetical protein
MMLPAFVLEIIPISVPTNRQLTYVATLQMNQ